MRKLKLFTLGLGSILLASCVSNPDTGSSLIDSNGGGKEGYISQKALSVEELGEGFNARYLPDVQNIKQRSGTIDVALDFYGNQYGWEKVAREYERLQSHQVKVNINTNYSGSTYSQKIQSEMQNSKTDWDICEGNLGERYTNSSCLHITSISNQNNEYCGRDVPWTSVLEDEAFTSIENHSTDTYIINSEVMQTCWFVNKTALDKAGEQGYKNANGEIGNPVTWDDLISLCDYMVKAGYENPLGISLTDGSIHSTQYTWLTRIYGDYYYRQFYPYAMSASYWDNYDPTQKDPELNDGYGVKFCKIANIMLAEGDKCKLPCGFQGPGSDLYKDLISQLYKMRDYIVADSTSLEFQALRDQFRLQNKGTKSAQILLDYLGNGCVYSSSDAIDLDYFDYPEMKNSYVTDGSITRDIGGNGGFLSIIKHPGNANQNNLNIDFMKFFMSPYGQTLYYQGLAEHDIAPMGLSTVKNKYIVIPEKWTKFFQEANQKVSFNGNVDGNIFISWGGRFFSQYQNTEAIIVENTRRLLLKTIGSSAMSVDEYISAWKEACFKDYKLKCQECQWPETMYLDPTLPY